MGINTFVDVYKTGYSRAANRCNSMDLKDNRCNNPSANLYSSAEWTEGRSGKDRCTSVCSETLSGISGQNINPCIGPVKATTREFIQRSRGFNSLGDIGLKCDWDINDTDLRTMSQESRYTNATITNTNNVKISLYDQLLFGIKTGPENTTGSGYCDNIANLTKVVHRNNTTCYEMIKNKINTAEALRKGRLLCASQPQLQQCKCINISQPGGVNYCLQNRRLPGCDKVVMSYEAIPARARTQFKLENQSTGCFNGTACAGSDIFLPEALPQVCNNTIAVCDQQIKVGDITGGTVNIDQEMKCEAKSESIITPPGSPPPPSQPGSPPPSSQPGSPPPPPETGINAYIPRNLEELKTNRKKQIGVGGVLALIIMILMCIVLIVTATSSSPVNRSFK